MRRADLFFAGPVPSRTLPAFYHRIGGPDSRVTPSGAKRGLHEAGQARLPRGSARFEFIYCISRPSLTVVLDWWYQSGSLLQTTGRDR